MIRKLWLLTALLALAPSAWAADGDSCTSDSHYSPSPAHRCVILADGRVETGASTADSAIFDTRFAGVAMPGVVIVAYGRCPTNCEPGTARLYESDSSVSAAPNVWHEIGAITGCGSGFVSEYEPLRPTKRYLKAAWDADITDADCTTPGVDVTLTVIP